MRVALYTRVSSQEQAQHGVSLADQRERLEAWAKLNGYEIAGIYSDEGFTGGNDNRPELQRLMRDARTNLFECIIVSKLDRFFRNIRLLLNYIHELEQFKVSFMTLAEGINTAEGGMGRVTLNLLGSIAEWEHDRIGERIRDFRAHLANKGQWSSGRTTYGYRFDKVKKELIIDPNEAAAVRFIFSTYTEKQLGLVRTAELANKEGLMTPRAGRRQHFTWNQSVIRHILTHGAYRGGPNEDWVFRTPAIVTPELWDAAQRQLSSNRHFRATETHSPYQGLFICGKCGHTLRIGWNHNTDRVWECPSRLKRLHLDNSPRCTLPRMKLANIEGKIVAKVQELHRNPEMLNNLFESTLAGLIEERSKLERKLKPIRGNIDRLKADMQKSDVMYELGRLTSDEYRARIAGLRSKIAEFERQTNSLDPLSIKQLNNLDRDIAKYRGILGMIQPGNLFQQLVGDLSTGPVQVVPTMPGAGDKAFVENPHLICSQILRKLGLSAYVFADRIELKGIVRQSNVTSGLKEERCPFCIEHKVYREYMHNHEPKFECVYTHSFKDDIDDIHYSERLVVGDEEREDSAKKASPCLKADWQSCPFNYRGKV